MPKGSKTKKQPGAPADEALKTGLRKKLRAKMRMFSTCRQGGSRQEVQKIMTQFNEGDEEKTKLMKDIQEDVKGMSQKDAKKYLKKVVNTMDSGQTDHFVDMVRNKLPSGQGKEIVNYIQRAKTTQEQQEKPQVNPETVYVPTRLMTEEQKQEALKQKATVVKNNKFFANIEMHVPMLTFLRQAAIIETTTVPKPKKKNPFVKPPPKELTDLFAKKAPGLPYDQRMKHLEEFKGDIWSQLMKTCIIESSSEDKIIPVLSITTIPMSLTQPIPETQEVVQPSSVPQQYLESVIENKYMGDDTWLYRYEKGVWTRTRNAYQDSMRTSVQYYHVLKWLNALTGTLVPVDWLLRQLANVGILKDEILSTDRELVLKLLCQEYRDRSKPQVNNVPCLPFVKISFKP